MLYSVLLLLCFLLIFLFFIGKDFADPLVLHTLSWFLVFLVGYFNYDKFYPLTDFFWDHWLLWFFGFLLGYLLVRPSKKNSKVVNYIKLPQYSKIVNCITVVFFVLTIVEGMTGGYGNFLMNLRLSFIFKTSLLLSPFFFLFTFIWPLFLYEGLVFSNKYNIRALLYFLLVYTLASGGKFGILMTVSAALLIFHQKKLINKRHLIKVAIFTTCAILLMGIFREHGEDSLISYIYAPSVAFQEIRYENTNVFWGHETFRFFYSAFNSLGFSDIRPPEDFYEYVSVPVMTNVFTVMRPFYMDFGTKGVFIGGVLYGLFFSYCYKGYLNHKIIGSTLYFGFGFAIVSVTFADLLFLNLSLVFRTLIISVILFIFNRKTF